MQKGGEIFMLDELATYLKVGKRTVYRFAAGKKIPFKVGGTWQFPRREISRWIQRQIAPVDDSPALHGLTAKIK